VDEEARQMDDLSPEVHQPGLPAAEDTCYRNRYTGYVHKEDPMDSTKFKCGRKIGASYDKLSERASSEWPPCRQCYP
jgi:hypothetical protein